MLLSLHAMDGKSVLVVDDDPLICWALAKDLSALNMSVSFIPSGMGALDEIRRTQYDLVFLDVRLPDANGIDLLEDFRELSPGTRVVVMTADADDWNRRRSIAAGALQFIEKPFELSSIRSLVRSMFGKYSETRRSPRYLCRVKVRIALLSPAPGAWGLDLENLAGVAEEVGAAGIRIATAFPLEAGQSVRLMPGRPDAGDSFPILLPPDGVAEVLWVARTPGGFDAGLRYLNPIPAS